MKKRLNPYKITAIIVLILTILFFLYSIINYAVLKEVVSEEVETYGLIGIFIFSFLFEFVPQYISPHILIVSSLLVGFNLIYVMLAMIIGSTFGSIAAFEIGYKLKKHSKLLFEFLGKEKTLKFEKKINNSGRWIIALAAVSPIPYIPILFGMAHLSRRNFFVYGIIPRVLGFLAVGLAAYWVI